MWNKIFEGKGFWMIFILVLSMAALAGMVVSFIFGMIASFFRYVYYLAIPAFVIALIIYLKKGRS